MRAIALMVGLCAGCNASPPSVTTQEAAPTTLPGPDPLPFAPTASATLEAPPGPRGTEAPGAPPKASPSASAVAPASSHRPSGCPEPSAPREAPGQDVPQIPGKLLVLAPHLMARSHGIGDEPVRALFCLANLTSGLLRVRVGSLTIDTRDAAVPEPYRTQPLTFDWAIADASRLEPRDGYVEVVVPAASWTALELEVERRPRIAYHVTYAHEAVFSVGSASVRGRGYGMRFRQPHQR